MTEDAAGMVVRRLRPDEAAAVVDCFRRVYGESYANELFYDVAGLTEALRQRRVGSVGAFGEAGILLGHMAMTVHPEASVVELGNTVVDPGVRGAGIAWKVGAELSAWCRELGYQGFLHYPTTDHHIMQRQSVKAGFEVGLMLGYIPAETYGKVAGRESAGRESAGRQAATIVYEPYGPGARFDGFAPADYLALLEELTAVTGLPRRWQVSESSPEGEGKGHLRVFTKRGLHRYEIVQIGDSLAAKLESLSTSQAPCLQVDFPLADPAIGVGVKIARDLGFRFCGWLPGFRAGDVLRLQRVTEAVTDLSPVLENPGAKRFLALHAAGF